MGSYQVLPSLQTLPISRCSSRACDNTPTRLSQPDQGFKRTVFRHFLFLFQGLHTSSWKSSPFPAHSKFPHLHTKGNVPTFFLREGTFVSIRFSLQSWKAAVWLYQLKSLIKGRECQPLLPREQPENVLPRPFWKEDQALCSSFQDVSIWLHNSDVPKSSLVTADTAPAHRDQPPSDLSSPGSPQDHRANLVGGTKLKKRDRLSEKKNNMVLLPEMLVFTIQKGTQSVSDC